MSDELSLADALADLESAEDFLNYFGVDFDPSIVHVSRLHILQRYHDYLTQSANSIPDDCSEAAERDIYRQLLQRAYQDFVESDSLTEKVFKVFKMHEPQSTFVSVDQLFGNS